MTTNGTLTVAPVTQITDKQPQAQCEFKIACQLRGFPIEITGQGRAADLKIIVDRLFDLGAEPPQASRPEPTKTNGAPICPVHNTPIAPSTKRPGTYYCKSITGQHPDDGRTLYCTKKA